MFRLNDDQPELQAIDPFQCEPPAAQQSENFKAADNMQEMYYEEYKKIYVTSFKLWSEGSKQIKKQQAIHEKIGHLEAQLAAFHKKKRSDEMEEAYQRTPQSEKKRAMKRNRRTAEEIERKYQCPHEYCDRIYGSEGSLQQHLKLKHPQLYKILVENQGSESFD